MVGASEFGVRSCEWQIPPSAYSAYSPVKRSWTCEFLFAVSALYAVKNLIREIRAIRGQKRTVPLVLGMVASPESQAFPPPLPSTPKLHHSTTPGPRDPSRPFRAGPLSGIMAWRSFV
jgi:hypothetical protein